LILDEGLKEPAVVQETLRVLVANEPRAYRETISKALRALRPSIDVVDGVAGSMATEVQHFRPRVVICSHLPADASDKNINWIVLYPNGEHVVNLLVDGSHFSLADLDLEGILRVIDKTPAEA
jgi:hypothetical protein